MNNDPLYFVTDFLKKTGEIGLAIKVVDAFANNSTDITQFNQLAQIYHELGDLQQAKKYATKVLNSSKNTEAKFFARLNIAKIYLDNYEPDQALLFLRANTAIYPNDFDNVLQTTKALMQLNQKNEAEKTLRTFIETVDSEKLTDSQKQLLDLNLSSFDLSAGNFEKGLREFFISIKNLKLWFNHDPLPFKFWEGGIYPGRHLICSVVGGGIGDELLAIRFIPVLEKLGFIPIFHTTRDDLCQIFNRCGYKTILNLDDAPKDSLWTFALHVPIYLGLKQNQVKAEKYLAPSFDAKKKWGWVTQSSKIKIGLRWMGAEGNEKNLHRNIQLSDMMNMLNQVFDPESTEYYSLQVHDGENETHDYPQIKIVSTELKSYDDTFALLENLDLVISTCTSVLHASAIVGTETIGLVPIIGYFPWQSPSPNNTSVWYGDNLKIFKQQSPKKWDEPLEEIKNYLIKRNPFLLQ
jgi:predicted negative regulator of RcsB-dependent stress response